MERRPETMRPPDCCTFRILATGGAESAIVAVGNEIKVDENLAVTALVDEQVDAIARADAHVTGDAIATTNAAAVSAGPPAAGADANSASDDKADSDGSSASDAKTRSANDAKVRLIQTKARDLVAKSDKYFAKWRTIGARGPVIVHAEFSGEARGVFPCAAGEDCATVSAVKIVDTTAPRIRGSVRVRLQASDSCGQTDACEFILPEP